MSKEYYRVESEYNSGTFRSSTPLRAALIAAAVWELSADERLAAVTESVFKSYRVVGSSSGTIQLALVEDPDPEPPPAPIKLLAEYYARLEVAPKDEWDREDWDSKVATVYAHSFDGAVAEAVRGKAHLLKSGNIIHVTRNGETRKFVCEEES